MPETISQTSSKPRADTDKPTPSTKEKETPPAGMLADAFHAVQKRPRGFIYRIRDMFQTFSQSTAAAVGSPWAFILAALVVIVWGVTGPLFRYSDTWQLVINTGTTIVTFLMVFLIQNTQNRDSKAIHMKLDELIRSKKGARNTLVDLENCTDEELDQIEQEFHRLRQRADHRTQRKGKPDTGVGE